jgi:hypothetical protein
LHFSQEAILVFSHDKGFLQIAGAISVHVCTSCKHFKSFAKFWEEIDHVDVLNAGDREEQALCLAFLQCLSSSGVWPLATEAGMNSVVEEVIHLAAHGPLPLRVRATAVVCNLTAAVRTAPWLVR